LGTGGSPVILATKEAEIRKIKVRSQPRGSSWETLSRRIPITKKDWQGDSSDKEHLLSKCEPLSSNSSATKKEKRKKKE
jgi:hypothetical protein